MISLEIANSLIYAMMSASRGRSSKRKSTEAVKPPSCSPIIPNNIVDDVWYDKISR